MKQNLFIPEMKQLIVLFGLFIFLCSCSTSYQVGPIAKKDIFSYEQVNEKLKGKFVKIILNDGSKIKAKDIAVSLDSVSWNSVTWTGGKTRLVPHEKVYIKQFNKIVTIHHGIGGLDGIGIAIVGGVLVGIIVGSATAIEGSATAGTPSLDFEAAGLFSLSLAGIIPGLIIGAIVGHKYNYEFQNSDKKNSDKKNNKMKWF